jgi:hypothetical protein
MSIASAASFRVRAADGVLHIPGKAIGPGKPMPGPNLTNPAGGAWGRQGRRDKGHKPKATVGPTDDIAGDNLGLLRACKIQLRRRSASAPAYLTRRDNRG